MILRLALVLSFFAQTITVFSQTITDNNVFNQEQALVKSIDSLEKNAPSETTLLFDAYTKLANLFYSQYQDDNAIPFFVKAYEISLKTNDFNLKKNGALNMSIIEENRKNLAKALVYRKEFDLWKDSLYNQEKIAIAEDSATDTIFKPIMQDADIPALVIKNKPTYKSWIVVISVLLFVVILTGTLLYIQKVRSKKVIKKLKDDIDALKSSKSM